MTALVSGMALKPVDLRTVDGDEARALVLFFDLMRLEVKPDDPPVPLEEHLSNWRAMPPHVRVQSWACWEGNRIVAYGDIGFELEGENVHTCGSDISVLPEFRRRGLGSTLLGMVVEIARHEGRRLLLSGTNERVPAGAIFAARYGGKPSLENHENQLLLTDLDWGLLERWVAQAPSSDFELGYWDDDYPEAELEAIARLFEVMNSAPKGDLDLNDERVTPEKILRWETQRKAGGTKTLTAWVRDRATGQYAGFTTLGWNPNRPNMLDQWGTAVDPVFRGHGLGKWLKAANLLTMLDRYPEVDRVRTGNADSNAPMLSINRAMGFKPFISRMVWQFEVADLLERLGA